MLIQEVPITVSNFENKSQTTVKWKSKQPRRAIALLLTKVGKFGTILSTASASQTPGLMAVLSDDK